MKAPPNEANDYPFDEVCEAAKAKAEAGWEAYQKFTCGKCGARQTMSTPNVFYTSGCCEECLYITDIQKAGCNFMLVSIRQGKDV